MLGDRLCLGQSAPASHTGLMCLFLLALFSACLAQVPRKWRTSNHSQQSSWVFVLLLTVSWTCNSLRYYILAGLSVNLSGLMVSNGKKWAISPLIIFHFRKAALIDTFCFLNIWAAYCWFTLFALALCISSLARTVQSFRLGQGCLQSIEIH